MNPNEDESLQQHEIWEDYCNDREDDYQAKGE